jgi:hypothetical protein
LCARNNIDEGIKITEKRPGKASHSMRFNRESVSNVIDESDSQLKKHDDPRISTLHGITID